MNISMPWRGPPIPTGSVNRVERAVALHYYGGISVQFLTLAGTLTSSGALVKVVNKVLAGTLTSSGALVNVLHTVRRGGIPHRFAPTLRRFGQGEAPGEGIKRFG